MARALSDKGVPVVDLRRTLHCDSVPAVTSAMIVCEVSHDGLAVQLSALSANGDVAEPSRPCASNDEALVSFTVKFAEIAPVGVATAFTGPSEPAVMATVSPGYQLAPDSALD